MGEYKTGQFGYFEFTTKVRIKGYPEVLTYPKTGHFLIIDQDRYYVMLKEEEIEIPVAKRDITLFIPKGEINLLQTKKFYNFASMNITAITVNYNTPDFLERLLSSFRKHYPDIPFIVIDGSDTDKYNEIKPFTDKYSVEIHHFNGNIHHGPGLAYGLAVANTERVLFLDSDLIVVNPGFVEDLNSKLHTHSYGIGDVQTVNEKGFNVDKGMAYLHPACALINKSVAILYPLPIKHGAPMINAMIEINKQGRGYLLQHEEWVTNDFRNTDKKYIIHDWQGTVNRTGGYHL